MIAMLMVAQTANSACMWIAHQPEFPEEAKKFKKVVQFNAEINVQDIRIESVYVGQDCKLRKIMVIVCFHF